MDQSNFSYINVGSNRSLLCLAKGKVYESKVHIVWEETWVFWNKEYKGISISFEDRVVRIKCDEVLMNYLARPGNDALILSEYILGTYYDMYHKILQISQNSLAVEILIHAYVDKLCLCIQNAETIPFEGLDKTLKQLCQIIGSRTEIIDCGEKEVDHNRFVFDGLEKFHGVIYKLLGDRA